MAQVRSDILNIVLDNIKLNKEGLKNYLKFDHILKGILRLARSLDDAFLPYISAGMPCSSCFI